VTELRLVPDRRQHARGGRRSDDREGYAPMVVVIDGDATRLEISEAILAKLRFAVAPFGSVEKALAAMHALRPQIIVAREDAAKELRGRIPADRDGREIPLLSVTPELSDPEVLVEALRQMMREHREQTI
jgi:PleD family two-component response regulator